MKELGYVYILTNPSFKEDWVKIGMCSTTVEQRVKKVDSTGVPLFISKFPNLRIRNNRAPQGRLNLSYSGFAELPEYVEENF